MRGEVEIWRGDKLIHKEHNMLTDGAGALLADIMTVSPSLSGVEDHATSSILDSSNYTIQAISFGTGSDAFRNNAYLSNTAKQGTLVGKYVKEGKNSLNNTALMYFNEGNPDLYLSGNIPTTSTSSYEPLVGLPSAPNPTLSTLEVNTSVASQINNVGQASPLDYYSVSSYFPGNGQLVNFMPQVYASSIRGNSPSATSDLISRYMDGQLASYMGAFPDGSSSPHNTELSAFTGTTQYAPAQLIYAFSADPSGGLNIGRLNGYFNEVSSMDISGHVNMVMSGSPNTTVGYAFSGGASGLCVSGGHDAANSGTVEYTVSFASGDLIMANHYGGIYHLGLWTIDMNKSLLNGNSPPFAFAPLNNPRKYRLFARKGLSKNLCFIQDVGARGAVARLEPLTIKWRLHFI